VPTRTQQSTAWDRILLREHRVLRSAVASVALAIVLCLPIIRVG
jgi:hypothetical protein